MLRADVGVVAGDVVERVKSNKTKKERQNDNVTVIG